MTASQQKPCGCGQHCQVDECQGFIQRSQSSDSDGAGAGSRTEGVGRRSGAVDQIARKDDESTFSRANIGRSSQVASSSRRDGGGERRVPQETRKIPLSFHPTCPGRQSKVWFCFSMARDRSVVTTSVRSVGARYGLRGQCVGKALHPGPHVCAYCWAMRCSSQATRQERGDPSMMIAKAQWRRLRWPRHAEKCMESGPLL